MTRLAKTAVAAAVVGLTLAGCSARRAEPPRAGQRPAPAASSAPAPRTPATSPAPGSVTTSPAPASPAAPLPSSNPLAGAPVPAASLPVPPPSPASVNFGDPTAVSRAAVITQWTVDTATDASQYQAELRSAPFLTAGYLAGLQADPPAGAPGAQWNQWAAHRAYTTVAASPDDDDQPADTATAAVRQWSITVAVHGAGGWSAAPVQATVFVQLVRGPGAPWLVSGMLVDS